MEDDGGSTGLLNVRLRQWDYTALWAMMKAVRTSETSVYFNNLIRRRGRRWRQYGTLKRPSTSTRLYGAVSQKTVMFILAVVRTWNLAICRMASLLSFRHTGLHHTPNQLSHQWVWPRNGSLARTLRGTRQILSFNHFTCYKASQSSIA
jgi:hypothetical protein